MSRLSRIFAGLAFLRNFRQASSAAGDTAMFIPVDQYDHRPGPEPARRKDGDGNPLPLRQQAIPLRLPSC